MGQLRGEPLQRGRPFARHPLPLDLLALRNRGADAGKESRPRHAHRLAAPDGFARRRDGAEFGAGLARFLDRRPVVGQYRRPVFRVDPFGKEARRRQPPGNRVAEQAFHRPADLGEPQRRGIGAPDDRRETLGGKGNLRRCGRSRGGRTRAHVADIFDRQQCFRLHVVVPIAHGKDGEAEHLLSHLEQESRLRNAVHVDVPNLLDQPVRG